MSDNMQSNIVARYVAEIAGNEVTQAESLGLTVLVVEDHVDMVGVLKATINAGGFDWSAVSIGDEIKAGFGGSSEMAFSGFVTGVRHHSSAGGQEFITVIAMDPLCKLRASRRTKVYDEDSTDSDIVSALLGEAGVDPGTVDSTSAKHKYVIQRNESDLTFLKRLASRNGYLLMANPEGKVDFKKVQYSGSAIELEQPAIMSFDYTISHQNVPTGITVLGWNYVDKVKVEGAATDGDIEAIGGGANAVAETGTIWQEDAYISDVHVSDDGAAKEMAIGELNRAARQFVRGHATVQGNGEIKAGALVSFKDFATGFNPEVFVISSRHIVEDGNYTTEFQFVGNTKPA
jgi:phage protein D